MKKIFLHSILLICLSLGAFPGMANANSKIDKLIQIDTTERLENISELKNNIRSLKLQIRTLEIALVEAKKKNSNKRTYIRVKRISDAVTALATMGGALFATFAQDKIYVVKVTSLIFGISSSVSVIADLAADLTVDEAANVTLRISEVKPILSATETNLALEVKILCKAEPSNQMCK